MIGRCTDCKINYHVSIIRFLLGKIACPVCGDSEWHWEKDKLERMMMK